MSEQFYNCKKYAELIGNYKNWEIKNSQDNKNILTGEYALNGNGRRGGWYILADDAPELAKYNMKKVYGKDGKVFYFTKGKEPSRALYKAWEQNKSRVQDRIGDVLRELNEE